MLQAYTFCISKLWLCRFPFGCCFTTCGVVYDVLFVLRRCRFFRVYEVHDRMTCEWWNGRYVEGVGLEVIGFISLLLPASADESRRSLRHGNLWFGRHSKKPPYGKKSRTLPWHRTARWLLLFACSVLYIPLWWVMPAGSCYRVPVKSWRVARHLDWCSSGKFSLFAYEYYNSELYSKWLCPPIHFAIHNSQSYNFFYGATWCFDLANTHTAEPDIPPFKSGRHIMRKFACKLLCYPLKQLSQHC
jgi:hypothetical protein